MFSVKQKREIADKVQQILRETKHPELPTGEVTFLLHVDGAAGWSWADIRNNGSVTSPNVNPWNEMQAECAPQVAPKEPEQVQSRSYLKRVATMKGESAPKFGAEVAPAQPGKLEK